MKNEVLTADEVGKILRVDRQRVYFLVREGLLPAIRLGQRQIRFSAQAIEHFLGGGGSQKGGYDDGQSNELCKEKR